MLRVTVSAVLIQKDPDLIQLEPMQLSVGGLCLPGLKKGPCVAGAAGRMVPAKGAYASTAESLHAVLEGGGGGGGGGRGGGGCQVAIFSFDELLKVVIICSMTTWRRYSPV